MSSRSKATVYWNIAACALALFAGLSLAAILTPSLVPSTGPLAALSNSPLVEGLLEPPLFRLPLAAAAEKPESALGAKELGLGAFWFGKDGIKAHKDLFKDAFSDVDGKSKRSSSSGGSPVPGISPEPGPGTGSGPAPAPSPKPSSNPQPSPEPTATSDPDPSPEPTATSDPDPSPEPTPEPSNSPSPDPSSSPSPSPSPDQSPDKCQKEHGNPCRTVL
jgi:outer membrane biosynthesis protein TonB